MVVEIIREDSPVTNGAHFTVTLQTGPTHTVYTTLTFDPSAAGITLTRNDGTIHTIYTTLTSDPTAAAEWLRSTLNQLRIPRHHLIIGLGVQWTPDTAFYNHAAATIQLCIRQHCLIFHLTQADHCPVILRSILYDPRITFVGLWNYEDAERLRETRHQLELANGMPVDLRFHVRDDFGREMSGVSIADITEEVMGMDVEWSKEVSRSDWDDGDLSLEQIQQASVKAFVAFAVGTRISAWNLHQ